MNYQNYNSVFNKWPPLMSTDRWVYGIWMIGNNYRNKNQYYGEYPPTYLNRVKALFPIEKNVLHLFSGSVDKSLWEKETLFDMNPNNNPDVCGDAHKLSTYFTEEDKFELILADPPYSAEDADKYGTPMVNRKTVLSEAAKILKKDGYIVWLDQVFPMFRKVDLNLVGTIGIIRSTNHRVRSVFIFQKQ